MLQAALRFCRFLRDIGNCVLSIPAKLCCFRGQEIVSDICMKSLVCLFEKADCGFIFPCNGYRKLDVKCFDSCNLSSGSKSSPLRSDTLHILFFESLLFSTFRLRFVMYYVCALQLIVGAFCSYRDTNINTPYSKSVGRDTDLDSREISSTLVDRLSQRTDCVNLSPNQKPTKLCEIINLTSKTKRFASERIGASELSASVTDASSEDNRRREAFPNNSSVLWTLRYRKASKSNKQRSERKGKSEATPQPLSCTLHLVADHLFFRHVGGGDVMATANVMKDTVRGADALFRSTDFDQDGVGDNVGFRVANITVLQHYPSPYFTYSLHNDDHLQYLQNFSRADHSRHCLAVVFTYMEFKRGVGGVAWVASSSTSARPGGICQRRIYVAKEAAYYSFNTAAITFLSRGQRVSRDFAVRTITHELGHCFGSTHDGDAMTSCKYAFLFLLLLPSSRSSHYHYCGVSTLRLLHYALLLTPAC